MKKLTLLAFIALTIYFPSAVHAADGTPLWTNALSQLPGLTTGQASARVMMVDTNGNSYVAGSFISSAQTDSDFLTIKYSPTGNVIWARTKDGAGIGGNDVVTALALDTSGNVYVVGKSPGSGTGNDFTLAKYSSGGTFQRRGHRP